MRAEFWKDKRVVITGHTGFKGSWLALWLKKMGARITGLALPPNSRPALFEAARVAAGMESRFADLRDYDTLSAIIRKADPECIFHLAAQPLVRYSYRQPLETFSANVMGTAHVLEAARSCPNLKVAVMVTTDKVYHNNEWVYPYRETDALGGYDPYSASKAACELVISAYRDSFLREQGVAVASARAGNVIGGGDWAEDRLIPDIIRCWSAGKTLEIRRPNSVRPWQHVIEPLYGYLSLAEKLWQDHTLAGAYNFGPRPTDALTVREVVELTRKDRPAARVQYALDTDAGTHEAGLLKLDVSRAQAVLGVEPRWNAEQSIGKTLAWYSRFTNGADAEALCLEDIDSYPGSHDDLE